MKKTLLAGIGCVAAVLLFVVVFRGCGKEAEEQLAESVIMVESTEELE